MTRPAHARNAEVAALHAAGWTDAEIASEMRLSPARVGAILRAAGVQRTPGRRPTGTITPHTARGRAALATLVADAEAAGLEVEAYLDWARGLP